MQSHRDIIARWPSIAAFASAIGVKYVTAQQMHFRASINGRYWSSVVRAAEAAGFSDITHELLAELAERRPHPRRRAEARVAA